MTNHVLHPSILRAYDIRGIVDDTLNLDDAKAIGIAFAACLRLRGYGNHVAVALMDDYHHQLWQRRFVMVWLQAAPR